MYKNEYKVEKRIVVVAGDVVTFDTSHTSQLQSGMNNFILKIVSSVNHYF